MKRKNEGALSRIAAVADVHRRRYGIGFVDHLFNAVVQYAFGFKDKVDGVTSRSAAAGMRRNVMGFGLYLLASVRNGDRKSALAHHGKIDDIVAHISDLVEAHILFVHDVAHRLHLERLALVDEFKLEVARAGGDGLADALGDDAALQTGD